MRKTPHTGLALAAALFLAVAAFMAAPRARSVGPTGPRPALAPGNTAAIPRGPKAPDTTVACASGSGRDTACPGAVSPSVRGENQ